MGLEVAQEGGHGGFPVHRVRVVERIQDRLSRLGSERGHLEVRFGQIELARDVVESEEVQAGAQGDGQMSRCAVQTVACSHELSSALFAGLLVGSWLEARLAIDSEDGARGQPRVDVGGAVEWIEDCGVLCVRESVVVSHVAAHARHVVLLGGHNVDLSRTAQSDFHDTVGHHIELPLLEHAKSERA